MSEAKGKRITKTVKLQNVRLAFPQLFEPKAVNGEGKAKYKASLLFDRNHPAFAEVQKAILDCAVEKWGDREDARELAKTLIRKDQTCLRDGDDKKQYDGFAGMWFVSASNARRPTVLDRDKSPLVEADGRPYGGCYVNAIVDIYPMEARGEIKRGIHATLVGVQFFADGDSFGGGRVADESEFEDLGEQGSADAFEDESTAALV